MNTLIYDDGLREDVVERHCNMCYRCCAKFILDAYGSCAGRSCPHRPGTGSGELLKTERTGQPFNALCVKST